MSPQIGVAVYLRRGNEILLAMKKRGHGEGYWNGPGGKPEAKETPEQTAVRECQEEIGVTPLKLQQFARILFRYPHDDIQAWDGYMYECREWEGEPHESEEMAPRWFRLDNIPYEHMWDDDKYWLPLALSGKFVEAEFEFDQQNNVVAQSVRTHA